MSFDATLTWWFTAILAVISLSALISTRSVSRRESLMQRFTDAVVLPVGDEAVVATVQRRVVSLARAYAFGTLVGLAVFAAVGSAIAAHFLSLRVLERPQPAENTLELAWDDALRAEALLTLLSLVGILSWIACSAVVYAVATGVDPGSPFTDGIVPQLSGLGMLSIVYFAAFGGGKKHFRFRLWPDIDAVNTSGLTA